MSPVALLNDGLLDVTMHHGPASSMEIVHFMRNALLNGGAHIYRNNFAYFRAKSLRIKNKAVVEMPTSAGNVASLGVEQRQEEREGPTTVAQMF